MMAMWAAIGITWLMMGSALIYLWRLNRHQAKTLAQLTQRLASAEQMQSLLARAHKAVLARAHSQQSDAPISPEQVYDRAHQLIAKGCSAEELARNLELPIEEAEIMVQLGRLRQTA